MSFDKTDEELAFADAINKAYETEITKTGIKYVLARTSPLDGLDNDTRANLDLVCLYIVDGDFDILDPTVNAVVIVLDGEIVTDPQPGFPQELSGDLAVHIQALEAGPHTLQLLDPETSEAIYDGEVLADTVSEIVLIISRCDGGHARVELRHGAERIFGSECVEEA